MKKIIIIYGPAAAGKTTQADKLATKYGVYKFGMGEKIRAEIEAETELGQQIKQTVATGLLITDDEITQLLKTVKTQATETGIVFDGFPRNESQAKILDEILADIETEVAYCFCLKIDAEEIKRRIADRVSKENRADDKNPETVENRIKVFNQESVIVLNHYQKDNKLVEIDGTKSVDEIFAEICSYLD